MNTCQPAGIISEIRLRDSVTTKKVAYLPHHLFEPNGEYGLINQSRFEREPKTARFSVRVVAGYVQLCHIAMPCPLPIEQNSRYP